MNCINTTLINLCQAIQSVPEMQYFALAGGTALALQLKHRKSIDLDFFSTQPFPTDKINDILIQKFGFQTDYVENNTLRGSVKNIKIDIISHQYRLIQPFEITSGIRHYSIADLAAMKLNAIAHNGTRIKDYIDIYFILKKYSLSDLINWYIEKYNQENYLHVLKSLVFFDDVETEYWPLIIAEKELTWEQVQKSILHEHNIYVKNYLYGHKR